MNWALFAGGVTVVLTLIWLWLVTRSNWAWPGLVASVGCLLTAALNSAAPIRGLVDPNYAGYGFGLLHADKGISVTILAGTVFLAASAAALSAVSRREGAALWLVAAVCAAMLAILAVPTIGDALADPAANAIQFGEYLTIPGLLPTAIILLLLTVPFVIGLVWAPRAALRAAASS